MMKRISISICALLLSLLLPLCRAESEILLARGAGLDFAPAFYAAAATGSRVYLCDAETHQYCVYDAATGGLRVQSSIAILNKDAQGEAALYDSPLALVQSNGELYSVELRVQVLEEAIAFTDANLYRLDPDDLSRTPVCSLDLSDVYQNDGEFSDCPPCKSALLADGQLYLLFDAPNGNEAWFIDDSQAAQRLLRFDCATGARESLDLKGALELVCPYEDRIIVARVASEDGDVLLSGYSHGSETPRDYLHLDGEGGAHAEHFLYDAQMGALYYSIGNHLWGVRREDAGRSALISSLPTTRALGLLALDDGRIAAYGAEQLSAAKADWSAGGALKTLTLSGAVDAEGFRLEHPEIQINDATSWGSEKILQGVLTQSSLPDVLILNPAENMAYQTLLNRGYLLPIQDESLIAFADALHPDLKRAACDASGTLCAIPIALIPQRMLAVNEPVRSALGLEHLPASWPEMLSLLENWPDDAVDGEAVAPFAHGGDDLRQRLLIALMQDYNLYRQSQAEDPGYDTATLRALLTQMERIDFAAFDAEEGAPHLFQTGFYAFVKGYHPEEIRGLPLSIRAGAPARLPVSVNFAAINPHSENPALALEFLKYLAENLGPYEKIGMLPSENAPLRLEDYDERLAACGQEVEALRARLNAAEPADRPELQRLLEVAEAEQARVAEGSWGASPAGVADFRRIAQNYGVLRSDALNSEDAAAMDQIFERFLLREIDGETFIREMDRRIGMRALEG